MNIYKNGNYWIKKQTFKPSPTLPPFEKNINTYKTAANEHSFPTANCANVYLVEKRRDEEPPTIIYIEWFFYWMFRCLFYDTTTCRLLCLYFEGIDGWNWVGRTSRWRTKLWPILSSTSSVSIAGYFCWLIMRFIQDEDSRRENKRRRIQTDRMEEEWVEGGGRDFIYNSDDFLKLNYYYYNNSFFGKILANYFTILHPPWGNSQHFSNDYLISRE